MNSNQHHSQSPPSIRRDSMSSQPSNHTTVSTLPCSERTPSTRNVSVPAHILASLDPPASSSRSRRFHSKSVSAQAKSFSGDTPACTPEPSKYSQGRSSRPGSAVGKLASALTRSSRSTNASMSQPTSPYDDIPPTPTSPFGARSHSSSHSPVSQNRLPSMTSESSTMLSAGLKRLLKKPSIQLRSGASSFSVPSDSEGSSRFHSSPHSPRPSPSHNSSHDATTTPRSFRALQQAREVSDTPGPGSQPTSNDSSPREQPLSWASPLPPRGREQKPRNVLRRKPSGSYRAMQPSKEKEKSKSSTSASPLSAGRRATVSVPFKDNVSPLSLLSSPQILRRKKSSNAHSLPSLTPAGAVVQAYKQQEQSREHIPATTTKESSEQQRPLAGSEVSEADEEVSVTPYYTVFGNTSGRVVAVGGPDDRWYGLDGYLANQRAGSAKPDSESRSLTRKVSNRWKKVTGGGVEKDDSAAARSGHMKGRQSLQENRSLGLSREQRGSLDRFGGDFVDLRSSEKVRLGQKLPSVRNGRPEHVRGGSNHESLGKEKGEEGGKIWKLMKRLSTGGLRDRYQIDKVAPPVPAIPQELLRSAAQSTTPRQTDTLTRIMTSPEHMAHSHTTMTPPKQRSGYGPRPSTAPKTFGGPRPSITTCSSSPISSDVASAKFFNRSQSVRSSTSSYGDEIPPPLPHFLDQHILSPKELHQFDNVDEAASPTPKSRKPVPRRSMSGPADHRTPARSLQEHQPLPCPPRRMGSNEKDSISSHSRPASPPIPSFSTTDPINAFSPKSPNDGDKRPVLSVPLPEFGQPPPPRPTRSSLRPGRNSSGRSPSTPSVSSPRTTTDEDESTERDRNRASSGAHSNASTTKPRPRSNSFGSTPRRTEQSPARSPLTFRELSSPRRAPLSEKEKADKWDDLLERSARAGGTLHLGGGDLMSDHLRFSNYSEIS